MSNRVASLGVSLCLLACPAIAWGQSPEPPATAAAKIGVINMQGAIANTAEGKKALAELQKKYEPRQGQLQQLQQGIASKQDQLQKQGTTLSDAEQARLSREIQSDQTRLKRTQEDLQADAQADQQEVVSRIGQKMVRLTNDYAQQNGYSIIMDGGPQTGLYYVAPQIDLTEIMIKRYDAANPAEAGSPPSGGTGTTTPAVPRNPTTPRATPRTTPKPKP
jgi:outer membrane protein